MILTDKQWESIGKDSFLIADFTPLAGFVENGEVKSVDVRTPYGTIDIENESLIKEAAAITHKVDFLNLWSIFKERGVKDDEEVIAFYIKNRYKGLLRLTASALPKLWMFICHKGTYKNIVGIILPENMVSTGLAIQEWKHELIK